LNRSLAGVGDGEGECSIFECRQLQACGTALHKSPPPPPPPPLLLLLLLLPLRRQRIDAHRRSNLYITGFQ
jgi:MYXO-CTERM domain-containing protein